MGETNRARRSLRIVDFRVRPPFRSFRTVFGPGRFNAPKETSDDALMDKLLAEMAAADIDFAVVMGRTATAPGLMQGTVLNADVAALVAKYPGKFAGFGSVDVRDVGRAKQEVDICVDLGLPGIAFDNPLSDPPLHNDDDSLLPIYEHCVKRGLIIAINSSAAIGPDLSYSNPVHIQRVAERFPTHPVVVTHGCWPWAPQMVAVTLVGVLLGRSNIYFQCDYSLAPNIPGGKDYIDAANIPGFGLHRRILFGTSYPAFPFVESVKHFNTYEFASPDVRSAILSGNAIELLKL